MHQRLLLLSLLFITSFSNAQQLVLKSIPVKLKKGLSFNLQIPQGYALTVAAEGLHRPRFFAKSPDGRLFVTDMHNRGDNTKGRLLILENWNDTAWRFEKVTEYLTGLHNPNQALFYTDGGKNYLYVAETGTLTRYEYAAGDNKPRTPGKVIATFPTTGLNYKYGGWHLTRSLAINGNKLYVSVGSSCNACVEKEKERAVIIEMNPDGSNAQLFASGLRNSVGMKWVAGKLWVTSMGRDGIGPDKPEDLFHTVQKNGYYGWPFYFQYRSKVYTDTHFKDSVRQSFVKVPPVAPWGFAAHSAPLGFYYFSRFSDSTLNNSFLVALHGSTSVWRQRGNAVVQLLPGGKYRPVVTGFLSGKTDRDRNGRPCDILQWNNTLFFISDDKNGVIYAVRKR